DMAGARNPLAQNALVLARQLRDLILRDAEVVAQYRHRISREPRRERDLLIVRVAEQQQQFRRIAADLLDPVTEAHRDEGDVAGADFCDFDTSVGAEDADARSAFDV